VGFPGAVVHDPRTDWCACEPEGPGRCDYRLLADEVVKRLNPRDGGESEVSLCIGAVECAAEFIASQPCTCEPGWRTEPCGRCAALGRWHDDPRS
jgi:hypothetical protein